MMDDIEKEVQETLKQQEESSESVQKAAKPGAAEDQVMKPVSKEHEAEDVTQKA